MSDGAGAALADARFRRYYLGASVSTFGDRMMVVAVPLVVFDVTKSVGSVASVATAYGVAMLSLVLFAGTFADRLRRDRVLIGADMVRAGVQTFMCVALLTDTASQWVFVAAMLVYGCASAFALTASPGLLSTLVAQHLLQPANALVRSTRQVLGLVAPALTGILLTAGSPFVVYAADAASFVVNVILLASLRMPRTRVRPTEPLMRELVAGWRIVTGIAWLRSTLAYLLLYNAAGSFVVILGPVVAVRELGGAWVWALSATAGAVGALLGGLTLTRLRPRRPLLAGILGTSLTAVQMLMFAIHAPLPLLMAGSAMAMAGLAVMAVLWATALQSQVPANAVSRVNAYDVLVSFLPLGAPAAGLLGAWYGPEIALAIGAVLVVAGAAAALVSSNLRKLVAEFPT